MGVKFKAATIAASMILTAGTAGTAIAKSGYIGTPILLPTPTMEIAGVDMAGADDEDKAKEGELKKSGDEMIPAERLRKPKKPMAEPAPMKKDGDGMKKPAAKMAPAKGEPKPLAKPAAVEPQPVNSPMQADQAVAGPYLRIDVGYGFASDPSGSQSAGNLSNESVDDLLVFGGGIGYRHNQNFRADVTVDYRPEADVEATTAASNTATSGVDALNVMINGYWDIGTFDQITPYAGAGIGCSRLETGTLSTTGGVASESGATSDNFAWSLSAGVAMSVTDQAAVDVNYRFTDLGEFKQAGTTEFDDLMAHEFRAGLRYAF